jgi:hypothetical protein
MYSKGRFVFSRGSSPPSRGFARRRRATRRLLAVAALSGLLLGVTAAVAEASRGDSVKGTAVHLGADPPFPPILVEVKAFSDPTGLNPRGTLFVDAEGIHSYTGNVTCLSVMGNQASIGIEIVQSSDPTLIGQGELWRVVEGHPDGIAGYEITPTPPVVCPPLFFTVPIVSGNYVVHDATR